MYCKYCGKQIEEDSLFCKHCGGNLGYSQNKPKASEENIRFLGHFKSFTIKTQILIIAYIIYLLILLSCLEYMYYYDFIIWAFLIPFIIVCLVYFKDLIKENIKNIPKRVKHALFGKSRKHENNNKATGVASYGTIFTTEKKDETDKTLIKEEALLSFAKPYGKMQLVEHTINSENFKEFYCLLEGENGRVIYISFAKNLGILSAEEISKKKDILIVKEYSDGSFELDYK